MHPGLLALAHHAYAVAALLAAGLVASEPLLPMLAPAALFTGMYHLGRWIRDRRPHGGSGRLYRFSWLAPALALGVVVVERSG